MKRRKPSNLTYGVDDPVPLPTCLLLGLQHSFQVTTALIFAMIVVQGMGGSQEVAGFFISMSLLAGGIATLLQALNKKGIGSGYFAPSICEPAYISASLMAAKLGGLPLVLGMTALSGIFEMTISRFVHRMRKIFTPEVMGLVVAMVGISIIPVAVRNFLGITESRPVINPHVLMVSIATLGTMVAITVWSKGKLRLFSVIVGMVTGYVISFLTGLMPSAHIQQIFRKPLLALPDITLLRWSFDVSLILPFVIASLCASVKTIGNLTTCQKINDADWKRPEMTDIRKGLFADGLGMSISGIIGGMGQSTASSNIGLSLGTGATSRQIAFTTGGILIALAFFPRFAEIFVLSVSALLQVYTQIENPWIRPIFTSSLYIATLLAILLTIIFQIGLTKRSRQHLEVGKTTYEHIRDLMEQHGALWGARQEVVNRAVSAVNALMEMIAAEELTKKPIQMDMSFDEFSLDLILQYEGKPIDITGTYVQPQILDENISMMQLALCMIRKDVDRLDVTEKDGQQRIVLHYDH